MRISKEKIVDASIVILNRAGADGLTMRALANELDVKAPSLYWHVKDKRELYGMIAEYICAQIEITADTEQPKKYLYEFYSKCRAKLNKIQDSPEVFLYSAPNTPIRAEMRNKACECLKKIGVKDENIRTAENMLSNYVLSFVAEEARIKSAPPESTEGDNSFGTQQKSLFYFESQFLYGIEVMFAGLKVVSPSK